MHHLVTQVKVALLHALQLWLTQLPQRHEYTARLLPYVVAAMSDMQCVSRVLQPAVGSSAQQQQQGSQHQQQQSDQQQIQQQESGRKCVGHVAWEVLLAVGQQYAMDNAQQLQVTGWVPFPYFLGRV